jgi:hypothetical protein
MATEADHHGHTPAAWTAVIIMLVGFAVGGLAVVLAQPWLFFTGIGLIALGVVVGKVMQMMGMGAGPGYHQEEAERRVGQA